MTTDKILIAALLAGGAFYLMSQKKEEKGVKETAKEIVKDEEAIQAKVIEALEGVVEAINLGGLALINPAWASWKHQIETGKAKIQIEKAKPIVVTDRHDNKHSIPSYLVTLFLQDSAGKLRKSDVTVRASVQPDGPGSTGRVVTLMEPSPTFKTKAHEGRQHNVPQIAAQGAVTTFLSLPAVASSVAQAVQSAGPGTAKEVATQAVSDALSAIRMTGNTGPLTNLLTEAMPASVAEAQRPSDTQKAISEAFAMQMMGFGFQVAGGVALPEADLDYLVSLASVLARHPKAQKLAREQFKLGGSGPLDLASLAEAQAKEQIETGQLTASMVDAQAQQMTGTQKDMLNKVIQKSIQKGLLTRPPRVPGYNITFSDFLRTFNVTPGVAPDEQVEQEEGRFNGIYGAYGAITSFVHAATNPRPPSNTGRPQQQQPTTRWGPVTSTATVPNADYLDY